MCVRMFSTLYSSKYTLLNHLQPFKKLFSPSFQVVKAGNEARAYSIHPQKESDNIWFLNPLRNFNLTSEHSTFYFFLGSKPPSRRVIHNTTQFLGQALLQTQSVQLVMFNFEKKTQEGNIFNQERMCFLREIALQFAAVLRKNCLL